ncbi:Zinc finger cchc domain-containing protein 9-like [Plakobranchus ocellatus]|uniref:Zinc finger cchc domain-containing protein 9-like n=1 Tax=Plakobranchus ocellatus TaxID=259542 RepID=A0AAV4DDC4_9GAST|nr:Zinc finger cchc domain-containing protein 9-like [Plakobranchus ocellatus]
MTRFAKRGFDNRKLNEATPWSEMKNSRKKSERVSVQQFKEQRREERRLKRQMDREANKVCYSCRGHGHMVSDCPFLSEANQQGSCFKCGSTEHSASTCSAKIPKGSFPFAQCFICGEKGHISKQCPDNPRGLYPRGGSCKQCGSVEHLKRDCPEFLAKKGVKEVTVDTFDINESGDAEAASSSGNLSYSPACHKKKAKVVKF